MQQDIYQMAYRVGSFFVADLYAFYQDTYKGALGKVQVAALDYLHRKGETSVKEVSQVLNISKQHASKITGRLEDLGYAYSAKDPNDGRGSLFALTSIGQQFINEHIELSNSHFSDILRSFPEKDQKKFLEALKAIEEVLDLYQPLPESVNGLMTEKRD